MTEQNREKHRRNGEALPLCTEHLTDFFAAIDRQLLLIGNKRKYQDGSSDRQSLGAECDAKSPAFMRLKSAREGTV